MWREAKASESLCIATHPLPSPQRCHDPLRPHLLSAPAAPAPAPAGDLALLCGLVHLLLAEGGMAADFVAAQTDGFAALEAQWSDWTPETVSDLCGIDEAWLRQLAAHGPQQWPFPTPSGRARLWADPCAGQSVLRAAGAEGCSGTVGGTGVPDQDGGFRPSLCGAGPVCF
jgi:hypothetical protein